MYRLSLVFVCLISSFLFFACQKEYSLELGKLTIKKANGSLYDTAGNCGASTVNGTFYTGLETGDTNYVTVTVNVTSPGVFRIETDSENGFRFFDSGYFGNTGYDTIHLQAFGKPTTVGPTDFTIVFDSSICGFTVNVLDSTGIGTDTSGNGNEEGNPSEIDSATAASNSWKFTDSSNNTNFDGAILDAEIQTYIDGSYISLSGSTPTSQIFQITVRLTDGQVAFGKYPLGAGTGFSLSSTMGDIIYNADGTVGTAEDSYITIKTFDPTTKIVTGNFRGWAKDADGNDVYINGGAYNATIQ